MENVRSQVNPPLLELLLHVLRGKGTIDGPLGELPYVIGRQAERGRGQLILLREVCAENALIISAYHTRVSHLIPELKVVIGVTCHCLTLDIRRQTQLQWYVMLHHFVHQGLRPAHLRMQKCSVANPVRRES